MKPRSVVLGAIFSAALCWCGNSAFAGGHGGGGSGGHGGGGGHGPSGSMSGSSARGYPAGMRGSPAGSYRVYGPYSARVGTMDRQYPAASRSGSIHHTGIGQAGNQSRYLTGNSTSRRNGSGTKARAATTREDKVRTASGIGSQQNQNAVRNRWDQQARDQVHRGNSRHSNVAEARQRHSDWRHGHHGHDWWRHHCDTIILIDWGYWGWADGWWYPAWGYDPYYSYYEYDGPIYGSNGVPPDEVVANVQSELQQQGYFSYAVDGVLGPLTQEALSRYQRDHRLPISGTIDPATVGSLGLGQ